MQSFALKGIEPGTRKQLSLAKKIARVRSLNV